MLNQKNKKSHIVTKTITRKLTSSNDALEMSGLNLEELAKTTFPSLKGTVEAVFFLKNDDQLAKVYTGIKSNLSSINENLTSNTERHDRIQLELKSISQSTSKPDMGPRRQDNYPGDFCQLLCRKLVASRSKHRQTD